MLWAHEIENMNANPCPFNRFIISQWNQIYKCNFYQRDATHAVSLIRCTHWTRMNVPVSVCIRMKRKTEREREKNVKKYSFQHGDDALECAFQENCGTHTHSLNEYEFCVRKSYMPVYTQHAVHAEWMKLKSGRASRKRQQNESANDMHPVCDAIIKQKYINGNALLFLLLLLFASVCGGIIGTNEANEPPSTL